MNRFRKNGGSLLIGDLTESLEDYLEIIFRLLQTSKVARVRDIAKSKNVKTSSVISALQRLAKEGLVDYQAREYVDLTASGRDLAFRLLQRHTFLKRFLTDLLQVDPETAEHDACSMEHAISVTTLDRITALSEFLTYCPKVGDDPIAQFRDCWLTQPNRQNRCEKKEQCGLWKRKHELEQALGIQCISEMPPGSGGYIARIMADQKVRSQLIHRGILPTASLRVISQDPKNGVRVVVSGEEKRLEASEAAAVYIWARTEPQDEPLLHDKMAEKTLAQLTPGSSFQVQRLTAKGEIRQRLLEMGFVRGAKGKILREALLKDPIEIELKGYLLSLRRAEADVILVEPVETSGV